MLKFEFCWGKKHTRKTKKTAGTPKASFGKDNVSHYSSSPTLYATIDTKLTQYFTLQQAVDTLFE